MRWLADAAEAAAVQAGRFCRRQAAMCLGAALRLERSELIHSGKHLGIHDYLRRAFPHAFEQREHLFRRHDGPVDSRRWVPGVSLEELADAVYGLVENWSPWSA
jgi:hypothetical protein